MTVLFGFFSAGLGLTLLLAGLGKATILPDFASSAQRFMPAGVRSYAQQAAMAAIVVEIGAGLATLLLPASRPLAVVDAALFAVLLLVSVIGYQRYRGSACRCFGAFGKGEFNRVAMARNALLVAAASAVLAFGPARPTAFPAVPWIASAVAVVVVSGTFLQASVVLDRVRREI